MACPLHLLKFRRWRQMRVYWVVAGRQKVNPSLLLRKGKTTGYGSSHRRARSVTGQRRSTASLRIGGRRASQNAHALARMVRAIRLLRAGCICHPFSRTFRRRGPGMAVSPKPFSCLALQNLHSIRRISRALAFPALDSDSCPCQLYRPPLDLRSHRRSGYCAAAL